MADVLSIIQMAKDILEILVLIATLHQLMKQ